MTVLAMFDDFRPVSRPSMERREASMLARALEDARQQAELLAASLRGVGSPDAEFLLAHAQHLLACCREIADARTEWARG